MIRSTSLDSLAAVQSKVEMMRERIVRALKRHPRGLTDEQLCRLTHLGPSTERPRRVELCARGQVVDSELRRPVASGRSAVVWRLSETSKGADHV